MRCVFRLAVYSAIAIPMLTAQSAQSLSEFKTAKEIAMQILVEGRSLLMKEVGEKGEAGATQACSTVALDLAKKHEKEGWRIRRVSDKIRNPNDTADSYEASMLKKFAEMKQSGKLSPEDESAEIVTEGGNRYLRYMKPIQIAGPICLKCHGSPSEMGAEVRDKIAKLYPADQATGYKLQDLRGAVSIKMPLGSTSTGR
jgi:hypothetical protein